MAAAPRPIIVFQTLIDRLDTIIRRSDIIWHGIFQTLIDRLDTSKKILIIENNGHISNPYR